VLRFSAFRVSAFRLLRGSPCAFLDALFSCCIVRCLGIGIIKRKKGSVLGEAMYEVNFIKARRLVKGQPEYLIKWKGFDDDKYDTWEGLANLSGLEPDLATFEAQQKRDQEDYAEQMAARKAAKAAASGKGGLRAARSSAAVSAAGRLRRARMRTERRPKRDMYVRYLPRLEKAVNCG